MIVERKRGKLWMLLRTRMVSCPSILPFQMKQPTINILGTQSTIFKVPMKGGFLFGVKNSDHYIELHTRYCTSTIPQRQASRARTMTILSQITPKALSFMDATLLAESILSNIW